MMRRSFTAKSFFEVQSRPALGRARTKKSPEGLGEDDLGGDGRKPAGQSGVAAPARGTAQKSGAEAEQLKKALAPKPTPEAARKKMLDALFERLRQASDPEDAHHIAES